MSNAIFPALPGLEWGITKTPTFSTKIQKAPTGREVRIAYMQAPMVKYGLSYEFLRDLMSTQNPTGVYAELKTLMGFYLARQGSFDSFLYSDPTDNTTAEQPIGYGDGTTTSFQLIRTFGSQFAEVVENIETVTSVTFNGVEQSVTSYGIAWNETADTYVAAGASSPVISYGCAWDESTDSYYGIQASQINPQVVVPVGVIGETGIITFAAAPARGTAIKWSGTYYYRCRFDSDSYDFVQMMQDIWNLSSIAIYGSLQNRV